MTTADFSNVATPVLMAATFLMAFFAQRKASRAVHQNEQLKIGQTEQKTAIGDIHKLVNGMSKRNEDRAGEAGVARGVKQEQDREKAKQPIRRPRPKKP